MKFRSHQKFRLKFRTLNATILTKLQLIKSYIIVITFPQILLQMVLENHLLNVRNMKIHWKKWKRKFRCSPQLENSLWADFSLNWKTKFCCCKRKSFTRLLQNRQNDWIMQTKKSWWFLSEWPILNFALQLKPSQQQQQNE